MKIERIVKNPFDVILDAYHREAEGLFEKMRQDLDEFKEPQNEVEEIKQRMLKAAFAYFCMEYLHSVAGYPLHEDSVAMFWDIGFDQHENACYFLLGLEGIEWDEEETKEYGTPPFERMLDELLFKYKAWWAKEVIDQEQFVENIWGKHEPNNIDVWFLSNEFFDGY